MKKNLIRLATLVFILSLLFSFSPAAHSAGPEKTPRIDYEVSDGNIALVFTGISLEDVADVLLNGESILERVMDPLDSGLEYVNEGVIVRLGNRLLIKDSGTIEVLLINGERHVLEPIVPQASCTSCAPAIYGAVQCDSVKSSVGTPPYPCCDNNSNGKATDTNDGNCTWYAWYKAKNEKGWTVPNNWGGAGGWCTKAGNTPGWKCDTTPRVNTIACSSSLRHVAWVTSVSSDKKTITVQEMNCKCPTACIGSGARTKSYSASSFKYISPVGYVSVSKGVNVAPSPVVLGQNFTIGFTLKERRGAAKTFENIAIAILDPSGTFIFDFAMFPLLLLKCS